MNPRQIFDRARMFMGIIDGQRAFGGPLRAIFGLTNRCNVRCIHCYYYSPYLDKPLLQQLRVAERTGGTAPDQSRLKEIQKIDIDMERLRFIARELAGMNTRYFEFAGNGEPFVHPQAMDLFSFLRQMRCHCLVKTNGTLIDRNMADELIRIGVDELRVTTMAGTPQIYMNTHPGVADKVFYHLKDTLSYISQQKEQLRVTHPRITLNFVIVRHNVEDIFDFALLATQVKAEAVRFKAFSAVDDPCLANVAPAQEQTNTIHEQLDRARQYLSIKGIPCTLSGSLRDFYIRLDTSALYRKIPCYYGWLAVRVDADGEVHPCCRCYGSLGNIYQDGFKAIWNGPPYRHFREETLSLPQRLAPMADCDCHSCIHYVANVHIFRALHPLRSRREDHRNLIASGRTEKE